MVNHPAIRPGVEVYRDRPILYGCGNLINDSEVRDSSDSGGECMGAAVKLACRGRLFLLSFAGRLALLPSRSVT